LKNLFFIFLFLITIQVNDYGQTKSKFKVYIVYNFDDYVKGGNVAKSHLERELRMLGDVELIQKEEYLKSANVFALDIALVTNILEDKTIIGYVMFAVFTAKLNKSPDTYPVYLGSSWAKGNKDKWEFITSSIIAEFDQGILRNYRR